jgi:hypothetical protein
MLSIANLASGGYTLHTISAVPLLLSTAQQFLLFSSSYVEEEHDIWLVDDKWRNVDSSTCSTFLGIFSSRYLSCIMPSSQREEQGGVGDVKWEQRSLYFSF